MSKWYAYWYGGVLDDDLMTAYNKGNKKVLQDAFGDASDSEENKTQSLIKKQNI